MDGNFILNLNVFDSLDFGILPDFRAQFVVIFGVKPIMMNGWLL